ncbi:MAG TPA: hypothetical protein VKY40_04155 [Halanaerobiales bacterium]|nr:hypothetical protein [Halanaerobiales bacterium]
MYKKTFIFLVIFIITSILVGCQYYFTESEFQITSLSFNSDPIEKEDEIVAYDYTLSAEIKSMGQGSNIKYYIESEFNDGSGNYSWKHNFASGPIYIETKSSYTVDYKINNVRFPRTVTSFKITLYKIKDGKEYFVRQAICGNPDNV